LVEAEKAMALTVQKIKNLTDPDLVKELDVVYAAQKAKKLQIEAFLSDPQHRLDEQERKLKRLSELLDLLGITAFRQIPIQDMRDFVVLLLNEVVVESLSPHFYTLDFHWPVWGLKQHMLLKRWQPLPKQWHPNEIEALLHLYPTASHREIYEALPTKTLDMVENMANKKKVKRMVPPVHRVDPVMRWYTLEDMRVLEKYGVSLELAMKWSSNRSGPVLPPNESLCTPAERGNRTGHEYRVECHWGNSG
jgi:hypothetical protein